MRLPELWLSVMDGKRLEKTITVMQATISNWNEFLRFTVEEDHAPSVLGEIR